MSDGTDAKDDSDRPARYAANGTQEVWAFDPRLARAAEGGGPWRLQV